MQKLVPTLAFPSCPFSLYNYGFATYELAPLGWGANKTFWLCGCYSAVWKNGIEPFAGFLVMPVLRVLFMDLQVKGAEQEFGS